MYKLMFALCLLVFFVHPDDSYNEEAIKKDVSSAWNLIKDQGKKTLKSVDEGVYIFMRDEQQRPLGSKALLNKLTVLGQKAVVKAQYYFGIVYLKGKDIYQNRDDIMKRLDNVVGNELEKAAYWIKTKQ